MKTLTLFALASLMIVPLAIQAQDAPAPATITAKAPKAAVKPKKAKVKAKAAKVAVKEHWVCPMHDGGESDHAGKCPKCGMDLVKEAN